MRSKQILFSILLIIFFCVPFLFSAAQNVKDLRDKISARDSDISALEKEIASYQSQLDGIGAQKNTLSGAIKALDLTRKKLETDITLTQKKIDKTNLTIASLGTDIVTKQSMIKDHLQAIKLEIQATDSYERNGVLETLLSSDTFTDVWNDLDNIATVREKIREDIKRLNEVKGQLEDTRQVTINAKVELIALQSKLGDQKKIVVQNTAEKNKLLSETKNNEAAYQALLLDRLNKKAALEKELQDLEGQLKFILDPSKLPGKGALDWPLDNIFVTSNYGPRWSSFHRGTDFRAPVGTPVKALADGVIQGAGDTDLCCPKASFGKWIFIEYKNGLSSTYGHLSLITSTKGQVVKKGQVVGYSGNTGSSTGPHLHVSVYVSSGVKVDSFASKSYVGQILTQPISAIEAYLDPMKYLPEYTGGVSTGATD